MKKVIISTVFLSFCLSTYPALATSSPSPSYEHSSADSASTGRSSSSRTASDIQTVLTQDIKRDEQEKKTIGMGFFYNAKIILDTEKGDATVKKFDFTDWKNKNFDADVEAGIFSFSKEIGTDLTAGIILPYRKIKVKDNVKSKLTMYSIAPFVKFRTMKKGNFYNDLSFYTFLSLNNLKADLDQNNTKDKIDYKELGIGTYINPTYKFNDLLTLDFNFGYQYSTYLVRKADITLTADNFGLTGNKEDIKNSFKPRHLVNMGTSLTITPIPNGKVILGYAYSANVLGSQNFEEERANYYYIKAYYTFWLFKVSLGYKKTDDANNYEEDTYMASVSYNF
ncbi:MAG: hypothetical protein DSY60_01075 [Persephonella sp.]|nr:MAG: hypothetical protein DSY60_01075 [Persephonella sp.]